MKTQLKRKKIKVLTKEYNRDKKIIINLLTDDSSTKIEGNFFSVAITTPFAATTQTKPINIVSKIPITTWYLRDQQEKEKMNCNNL